MKPFLPLLPIALAGALLAGAVEPATPATTNATAKGASRREYHLAANDVHELRGLVESRLPRPDIEVTVLLPYTRGDLVARVHDEAEVLDTEHTAAGTLIRALVGPALADQLRPFTSAAVG